MSDPAVRGLFVTGTGTGVGKTFLTRGLARALTRRLVRVAALKPIETGCAPEPADALVLARACRNPGLAHDPAFYRVAPPLSPYAATLQYGTPPPNLERIAGRVRELAVAHDFTLVEAAGGLLVPLDASRTVAELAVRLALPLLLVAPDRLGVLSHVLTAHESAQARALDVAAVILTRADAVEDDPSRRTNAQILGERLPSPVFVFHNTDDDDDALADAAESAAILARLA